MYIEKVVLGLLTIPVLCSFKCTGDTSTEVEVAPDTVKIKHDSSKSTTPKWVTEAEIPAGAEPGEATVTSPEGEEFKFHHSGNTGEGPLKLKVEYYDPLVLQVPNNWTITSLTYTTPAGTGKATIANGSSIASSFGGNLYGGYATDFYVAEPGYRLELVTIPSAYQVGGMVFLSGEVSCPSSARTADKIKAISTAKILVGEGNTQFAVYPPIDIGTSFYFVNHNDTIMTLYMDFTASTCTGPAGNHPRFDLFSSSDWKIGTTATVQLTDLDPSLPASYMMGSSSLTFPGIPYGGLGCRVYVVPEFSTGLTVNPDGTATYSLPIPNDPGLVGGVINYQSAQAVGSNLLAGDVFRARVEE